MTQHRFEAKQTSFSLTRPISKCYKKAPYVRAGGVLQDAHKLVQIVPDAAKPQHFCLEVEARFRDSSKVHNPNKATSDLPGHVRPTCWAVNDL